MTISIIIYILKMLSGFFKNIVESSYFPEMVSAFLGAFFAFILYVVLSALDREREIKKDNFIASLSVEHLAARALNAMDWNLKELKNCLENLEDLQKTGPVDHWIELYKLALVHLPVSYDLTLKLTLLQYLQDTSNMFMMIDQLNIITDSTMDAHKSDFGEKMRLPDDKLTWSEKKKLLPVEIERMKRLIGEFRKVREEIQKTISRANTLNPKFAKESRGIIRKLFKRYRQNYTQAEIEAMSVALKKVQEKAPEFSDLK